MCLRWTYRQDMTPEQGQQIPRELKETKETPRVSVSGRIGGAPEFVHIPQRDNLLVGRFSVAEHPSQDQTIWHKVTVFGERAQKLQERFDSGELHSGLEVAVTGYRHERAYTKKDGTPGLDVQIYAVAIEPAKSDQAPRRGQPQQ